MTLAMLLIRVCTVPVLDICTHAHLVPTAPLLEWIACLLLVRTLKESNHIEGRALTDALGSVRMFLYAPVVMTGVLVELNQVFSGSTVTHVASQNKSQRCVLLAQLEQGAGLKMHLQYRPIFQRAAL